MNGLISDEAGQAQFLINQPTIPAFPTTQYLPVPNYNVPVVYPEPFPYICYTPDMYTHVPLLTVSPAATPVLQPCTAPLCLPLPPLNLAGYSPHMEPVMISNSPSPVFGSMQTTFEPITISNSPSPTFFQTTTPSRSPSPRIGVLPNQSEFKILYELDIVKHQATTESIIYDYRPLIASAMRNILKDQKLNIDVVAGVENKSMTLYWTVHPKSCDFKTLQKMTQAKDFKYRLICELASVGNGVLNRHLHGSKQLIIIFQGWKCFQILKDALVSYNDAKKNLLKSNPDDKFDEKNVKDLLRVCEAPRGKALRGENVVGGHFRGEDVLRMEEFLGIVAQVVGPIKNATMIPSMKGKAQYKGWSIYVETPSINHVDTIIEACKTCKFKNAEIFTAFDKFQQEQN